MNFLVTGAAGFVGSHVCRKLALLGHNVVAVDNFNDYYSPSLKILRCRNLLEELNVNVLNVDLTNIEEVKILFKKYQLETIIHLAAQPGVRTPIAESSKYIMNNIVGFSNLLQTSVITEIPNFVYASSSSVYGNHENSIFLEDQRSGMPTSVYGATKLSNEILASAYVSQSTTKTRGLRFFTVYGPWGRPDMAYFRIISAALNNSIFELYGNGDVKRDFTYIEDITESIISLALELKNQKPGYSDVVNIGGGEPKSMLDLIETVNQICNTDLEIRYKNANTSDISYTCASTELLESLINKKSFVSLAEGVEKTIKWAKGPGIKSELGLWVQSSS